MMLSDTRKYLPKLKSALPLNIPFSKTRLVHFLKESDLGDGVKGLRRAAPGLIYLTTERVVLVEQGGNIWDFSGANTTMTLIETQGLSSYTPHLIRFNNGDERFYIGFKSRYHGAWANKKTHALFSGLEPHIKSHRLEQFKNLHRPNPFLLAGLVGLCLAGVAFAVISGLQQGDSAAPAVMTSLDDGTMVAFGPDTLYEFSNDGQLQSTLDLDVLGLTQGVSDATPITDRAVLVADRATGLVKHCRTSPWICESMPGLSDPDLVRAFDSFSVANDPRTQHFYVADHGRHRVMEFDAQGRYLQTVLDIEQICFPSKVRVNNGQLMVVNTNWHTIMEYSIGQWKGPSSQWSTVASGRTKVRCPVPSALFTLKGFHSESLGEERAVGYNPLKKDNVWPIDAARDAKGNLWVLNANHDGGSADLVKLDQFGELQEIVLDDTEPLSLLMRDEDLLVADKKAPHLLQVLNGGRFFNDFGDGRFSSQMLAISAQHQTGRTNFFYGLAVLAIGLLLAYLLLRFMTDRRLRWIPTA